MNTKPKLCKFSTSAARSKKRTKPPNAKLSWLDAILSPLTALLTEARHETPSTEHGPMRSSRLMFGQGLCVLGMLTPFVWGYITGGGAQVLSSISIDNYARCHELEWFPWWNFLVRGFVFGIKCSSRMTAARTILGMIVVWTRLITTALVVKQTVKSRTIPDKLMNELNSIVLV